MDPTKKFSFGFSIVKKPSLLVKPVPVQKEQVQYVDSFDGEKGKFSFQGVTREEEVKKKLVIPLIGTRSAYDVIKAKLDLKNGAEPDEPTVKIKTEPEDELCPSTNAPIAEIAVEVKKENDLEDVKPTLEALAAQEIIAEAKSGGTEVESKSSALVIAPDEKPIFKGEKESTLEDYENIPIGDYGLAMLRGMGWKENTGIGKDSRVVAPVATKVRPKRLGLGAEGSTLGQGDIDIPVVKGCFVKVLGGPLKGEYGIVEAVDGDCGRAFVKLDEGTISLSETVLVVVTKKEYESKGDDKDETKKEKKVSKEEKKYGINLKSGIEKLDESKRRQSRTPEKAARKDKSSRHDSSSAKEKSSKHNHRRTHGENSHSKESRKYKKDSSYDKEKKSKPKRYKSHSDSESPKRSTRKSKEYETDSSSDEDIQKSEKKKKKYRSKSRSPTRKKNRSISPVNRRRSKEKSTRRRHSDSESPPRRLKENKYDSSVSPVRKTKDRHSSKSDSDSESPVRSKKAKRGRSRSKEKRHKQKKPHRRSRSPEKTKKKSKKSKRHSSYSSEDSYSTHKKGKKK